MLLSFHITLFLRHESAVRHACAGMPDNCILGVVTCLKKTREGSDPTPIIMRELQEMPGDFGSAGSKPRRVARDLWRPVWPHIGGVKELTEVRKGWTCPRVRASVCSDQVAGRAR